MRHGICAVRMAANMTLVPRTTPGIQEVCPSPSSFHTLQDADTGIASYYITLLTVF